MGPIHLGITKKKNYKHCRDFCGPNAFKHSHSTAIDWQSGAEDAADGNHGKRSVAAVFKMTNRKHSH